MVTFSNVTTASHRGRRGVVVDGLDQVVTSFARDAATIGPKTATVAVASAAKAADRMRTTVPVDEGDLLDSITSDQRATVQGAAVYADAGPDKRANAGAFVSRFIEYGTVHMSPRPFIGPAAARTFPEFEKALRALR